MRETGSCKGPIDRNNPELQRSLQQANIRTALKAAAEMFCIASEPRQKEMGLSGFYHEVVPEDPDKPLETFEPYGYFCWEDKDDPRLYKYVSIEFPAYGKHGTQNHRSIAINAGAYTVRHENGERIVEQYEVPILTMNDMDAVRERERFVWPFNSALHVCSLITEKGFKDSVHGDPILAA